VPATYSLAKLPIAVRSAFTRSDEFTDNFVFYISILIPWSLIHIFTCNIDIWHMDK
jgi:hypothetical protein